MTRARAVGHARRHERGQALAELGIVITLFVFLVMGTLEFGHAWMVANMITHAARDGARVAAVTGASNRDSDGMITDSSAIRDRVIDQVTNVMDASGLSVVVEQPTSGGIPLVRVTVNGSVPFLFNLPGVGTSFNVLRSVTFRDEGR